MICAQADEFERLADADEELAARIRGAPQSTVCAAPIACGKADGQLVHDRLARLAAGVGLADVCALATGAGVGEEEFVAVVVGIVVGAGVAEEFVGAGVAATEGRGVGAAVGATTRAAVDAASQVMAIFWPIMQ